MPLQKQLVPISFAQGLETKSDPKQVVPGKLLELENCRFTKTNELIKRNGYEELPSIGTQGSAIASYQDELLAFDGLNVSSFSESLDTFTQKGQALSLEVQQESVVSNGYTQSMMDSCYHSQGLRTYVYEDSRGGIRYTVIDSVTGQRIVSDVQVDATGTRPKVFSLGNYVVITYMDTNLVYRSFPRNDPTNLSVQADIATDVHATEQNYDGAIIGTRLFLSYRTTGPSIGVLYMSAVLGISSTYEEVGEISTCIGVWGDSYQNVWVGYYDGSDVKVFVVSYELLSVVPADIVETVAGIRNVTGIMVDEIDDTEGTASVLYEVTSATNYNHYVKENLVVRTSGTVTPGTPEVLIRSVGLASKAFSYDSSQYVGLVYDSDIQPTYFVINLNGLVVAKSVPSQSGGLTARSMLPNVDLIGTSDFLIAWGKKENLEVESGQLYTSTGVIGTTLSFLSSNTYLRATEANNLHITGGFLSMYDGASVVEHGFHLYPEASTITSSTTTGGIQAGTFQYQVTYQWTDNQGQIHYSAPSTAQTVVVPTGGTLNFTADTTNLSYTLTSVSSLSNLFVGQLITGAGIPANTYITAFPSGSSITMSNAATASAAGVTISTIYTNKVTLVIPTLRVTAKQGDRVNATINVYRTQSAGSVFYEVTSITSPTFNTTTSDTVTFNDTVPDLYLSGNQLLYTTGGVLENIPAPPCSLITNYKNRIVIIPSENKLSYWISKNVVSGSPVEFTDFFSKQVNAFGGDVTAVGQLDEKLVLFKRNAIFITTGDGPNDTGQQDDLARPQLVTTDAGCVSPRSIATMPNGLMFKSGKGIYLLDRSLQVQYIGAPVERYNSLEITSSQLIPNTNEVRFTTEDGTILVYDYLMNQWAIDTNKYIVDSAIFSNRFTYLAPSGTVWRETIDSYLDGQEPIRIKLTTSWLSLAGLQGFQRVYQGLILGEYESLHRLMVNVSYDFNPNPTQQIYIDANELQPLTYGTSSPYGSDTVYGGEFPLYQYRIDMVKQKCQSIQFSFIEVPLSPYGQGLSLSGITILAGIKQGLYKIPASRQAA